MSIKDLFKSVGSTKTISVDSAEEIRNDAESTAYIDQYEQKKDQVVPQIDFSTASNFAIYGSAKKYYADAMSRIHKTYPYDGSGKEKLEWHNNSLHIDRHVFDNLYPRTNGNAFLGASYSSLSSTSNNYSTDGAEEYIFLKGGPHPSKKRASETLTGDYKATSSLNSAPNFYDERYNRESNLELSGSGISLEFWLKRGPKGTESNKQIVFDAWNSASWGTAAVGSPSYGRFRVEIRPGVSGQEDKFYVELMSGSQHGGIRSGVYSTTAGDPTVAIGTQLPITSSVWHHYALTFANTGSQMRVRTYVDGGFNQEKIIGSSVGMITGSMIAHIGGLTTAVSGTHGSRGYGKLSGSLDEFRFWKSERTSEQIGRHWDSQVNGGTNTDDVKYFHTKSYGASNPVDLGVYYKFNEGITGIAGTDKIVLDYSGRISNGHWYGYTTNSRFTGSAIVESTSSVSEFKDPILYSNHADVTSLSSNLIASGSEYDLRNNSNLFNTLPAWIQEEEEKEGNNNLSALTQIMGGYFDNLHMAIGSMSSLKDMTYTSSSNKPLPFNKQILESVGFKTSELFVNAEVLEQFSDMTETKNLEEKLHNIKNSIYNNIYNNVVHLYKTKGTEKSIRNLIRCFGVDEKLIKINMFADNKTYTLEDSYREFSKRKKFINFASSSCNSSVIYQHTSSQDTNSTSYLSASGGGTAPALGPESSGSAITYECETLFPHPPAVSNLSYYKYSDLTSSVFGAHCADHTDPANTTWPTNDYFFEVFSVKDQVESKGCKFRISGSFNTSGVELTSSYFHDVYDNSKWTFAVSVKPNKYPQSFQVSGTFADTYKLEFYGVRTVADYVQDDFTLTASLTYTDGIKFMTAPKRLYVGALRQDMTGTVSYNSDVKIGSAKVWADYVSSSVIQAHAKDTDNYGQEDPLSNTLFLQSGSEHNYNFYLPRADSLALDWNFDTVTGSNSTGHFIVSDLSSGSATETPTRYGWLSGTVHANNTGIGYFPASSTGFVVAEYLQNASKQLPEIINSIDMVTTPTEDEAIFSKDSRPIKYVISIEKNMYQNISEEMINLFATVKDYGALIGRPEERYRQDYKSLAELRKIFFDRVGNTPDLERFIDYYKWLDTSLSKMILNLVPATAELTEGLTTVIESHIFERNKYWSKFPLLDYYEPKLDAEAKIQEGAGDALMAAPSPQSTGQDSTLGNNVSTMPNILEEAGTVINLNSWPTSTPGKDSSGNFDEDNNFLWWKYHHPKDDGHASSGDTTIDTHRGTYREVIARRKPGDGIFRASHPATTRTIHGGTNNQDNSKDADFLIQRMRSADTDLAVNYIFTDSDDIKRTALDDIVPTELNKKRVVGKITMTSTDNYEEVSKTDIYLPLTFISQSGQPDFLGIADKGSRGSITVGATYPTWMFLKVISATDVVLTHRQESCNETGETPLQGPFTENVVGGYPHNHYRYNSGASDTIADRPEPFYFKFNRMTLDVMPTHDVSWHHPRSLFKRGPGIKRPVNIKNIAYTTASTGLGNYERNYEVVQAAGRHANNLWFRSGTDGAGTVASLYPEVPFLMDGATTSMMGYNFTSAFKDFLLPDRGSNKTVIVERFSAPGGPEINSRGYLDTVSETYSVYNALPYRNMGVIHGSGSGVHVTITRLLGSNVPSNYTNNSAGYPSNDGLRVLQSRHQGPGGADGVLGALDLTDYVTTASYHKIHRNTGHRIEVNSYSIYGTSETASVYDNDFVSYQIPKSDRQYSWITASLESRAIGVAAPLGFADPRGTVSSSAGYVSEFEFCSASHFGTWDHPSNGRTFGNRKVFTLGWMPTDYAGLNYHIVEPISASANLLGYPSDRALLGGAAGSSTPNYLNIDNWAGFGFIKAIGSVASYTSDATVFHALMAHRNGPYGWPSWKQIRAGQHPVARYHKKNNTVSCFESRNDFFANSRYRWVKAETNTGQVVGTRVRAIKNYTETPVVSKCKPIIHSLLTSDYAGYRANSMMKYTHTNNMIKFANPALNNTLNLKTVEKGQVYNTLASHYINPFLQPDVNPVEKFNYLRYSEVVFPRERNTYLSKVRQRENYTEIAGTGSNGYDRLKYRTFWKNNISERLRSDLALNSQGRPQRKLTGPKSGSCLSVWPCDTGIDLTSTPSIDTTNDSQMVGELIHQSNPYFTASICMYRRHILGSSLTATGSDAFNKVPVYATDILSGKAPWYDSYDKYAQDVRLIGQDYSIIPEFRISDHMDFYLNVSQSAATKNNNFLSLDGGVLTSSAESKTSEIDSDFFAVYSNSDFMKHFDIIRKEHEDEKAGRHCHISIKCSGVKKLLPYYGFYPQTRAVQLGTELSQSIGEYLAGSRLNNTIPSGSSEYLQCILRPLMAPGIFFNSIKSGVAVDWSIWTSEPTRWQHGTGSGIATFGYLDQPDMRLPFETLVDLTKNLPPTIYDAPTGQGGQSYAPAAYAVASIDKFTETKIYLAEPTLEPDGADTPYGVWMFRKKMNFELAMHNFLGEVPRFFLEDEKLTSYFSAEESKFKSMEAGKEYQMKVVMEKSPGFVASEGAWNSMAGGSRTMEPRHRLQRGSIYGPPVSSAYSGEAQSEKLGPFASVAYATYTPPYFFSPSVATLSFTPTETKKYSLSEILAGVTASYSNMGDWLNRNDTASSASMAVSASINLFGKTRVKKVSYGKLSNKTHLPTSFETPADSAFDVWSIGTRWECPILDFSEETTYHDTTTGRGLWGGYGKIIREEQTGVNIGLAKGSSTAGDLADIVGFRGSSKKKIGKLARSKKISEGLIAIPFVDSPDNTDQDTVEYMGKYFFSINKDMWKYQVTNKQEAGLAVRAGQMGSVTDIVDTSITNLWQKMGEYIMPPQIDFTLPSLKKNPYVAYIFEFDHTLDEQDLSDIWQGVMPKIAMKAEKQDVAIEHPLNKFEFFGGHELPENVRWMVFKIKKQAERNYFNLTDDSTDDDRFKFQFKSAEITQTHNYNWPYDFFSLVELAKVQVSNTICSDIEDPCDTIGGNIPGAGGPQRRAFTPTPVGAPERIPDRQTEEAEKRAEEHEKAAMHTPSSKLSTGGKTHNPNNKLSTGSKTIPENEAEEENQTGYNASNVTAAGIVVQSDGSDGQTSVGVKLVGQAGEADGNGGVSVGFGLFGSDNELEDT